MVRGRADPVSAFAPTREAEPATRRRARPLVGRERELGACVDLLEQALAGRGAVLTITGEAGIGKSRLLDALVEAAHERGAAVLRGAGRSDGRDVAYGAWRDAARELFPDRSEPLVAPLLGLPDARRRAHARAAGRGAAGSRRRADPRPAAAAARRRGRPLARRSVARPARPAGARAALARRPARADGPQRRGPRGRPAAGRRDARAGATRPRRRRAPGPRTARGRGCRRRPLGGQPLVRRGVRQPPA